MQPEPLSPTERELIERFGRFYLELIGGRRAPTTAAQARFIEVCKGRLAAESEHEIAFAKHRRLVLWRREERARQSAPEVTDAEPAIEDAPDMRAYPSRMDATLDDAKRWALKNGFR